MRQTEYKATKNKLKDIAIESKLVSGKWMIFPSNEDVDALWFKIAKAIINKNAALNGKSFKAKVSTCKLEDDQVMFTH